MFIKRIKTVLRDRRGASAIEYGLILAFVVIVMVAALTEMAGTINGIWSNVSAKVVRAS